MTTTRETHDAGPWTFHIGRGKNPSFHITTDGGYRIASTPEISRHKPEADQQHANARLIASAPELLASLQELENAIRFHFLPLVEQYAGTPAAHAKDEALARAVAAIKRATQD